MSRFYGSLTGLGKTAVTHRGAESTGLIAKADGWSIGARIELSVEAETDTDVVRVYATPGSNKGRGDALVCVIERIADALIVRMPSGERCVL